MQKASFLTRLRFSYTLALLHTLVRGFRRERVENVRPAFDTLAQRGRI